MTQALRIAAIAIALAAIVDPAFAVRRPSPIAVDVHLPPPDDPSFGRAVEFRARIASALGDAATLDGAEAPRALVLIGNAEPPRRSDVKVFAVRLEDAAPRVVLTEVTASRAFAGQRPTVRAVARGVGLQGRTTEFALPPASAGQKHTWTSNDDRVEIELPFTPITGGVEVARLTATTDGAVATVDVPVVIESRRPRVFVYEPRPSWAASFARQAIESDALFDVRALARTSRGVDTRTPGAPPSLAGFDVDSADVVIAGGLDALTSSDLTVLQRFANERQGSLILVPDAVVPDAVRAAFDLPAMKPRLHEQAVSLSLGPARVQASEVLSSSDAIVRRGQVVVATGLDAWRYRGDAFDAFWRAVAADAAARAVPKLAVRLEPMLARPGDEITVRLNMRLPRELGDGSLPPVSAAVIEPHGTLAPVRLWPGTAAGEFLGTFRAPAVGRYDVRVRAAHEVRDVVLVVDDDAVRPAVDRSAAIASLAESSGGAVVRESGIGDVAARIRGLAAPMAERRVRPMGSAWWAVAFAGVLGAEWTLRRKRGLR